MFYCSNILQAKKHCTKIKVFSASTHQQYSQCQCQIYYKTRFGNKLEQRRNTENGIGAKGLTGQANIKGQILAINRFGQNNSSLKMSFVSS